MSRRSMLLRIIIRNILIQPWRSAAALAALTVGAILASSFLSLYFDLPRKMTAEFKSLGPNLVVSPPGEAQTMDQDISNRLNELHPDLAQIPWLYAVGSSNHESLVIAGTHLEPLLALNPSWRIDANSDGESAGLSQKAGSVWFLAGEKVAQRFGWKPGQTVAVNYGDKQLSFPLTGILSTGESADSQVLLPLNLLQDMAQQQNRMSLIQLAIPGSSQEVEQTRQLLAKSISGAEIRPIREIVESEGRVVMKVKGLMFGLTAIVLGIVVLSVMTTISRTVFERRHDIGVMKAIGGSDAAVSRIFIAQSTLLGVMASILGYLAGFGLAQWAALRIFQSTLMWRWDVFPVVLAITLVMSLAATALPVHRIRMLSPAVVLKGD